MTPDLPADDTAATTPEPPLATPEAPTPEAPVATPEAPAAASAAAPPPPVGAPRDVTPPAPPRTRGRLGLILGLSLGGAGVLIIAALVSVFAVLSAQHAPSASVDRFLTALEKGHSTAALAQLSPAPTANHALVDDAVYEHVTNRVTKHRILSTTTHGSRSVVTARLMTKSGSFTQTFTLVTHKKSLLWDIWTVDGSAFPVIHLADDRPKNLNVTVDGVAIQKDGSQLDEFVALPGTYRFAVDGDTSLVTADAHSVTIGSFEARKSVTLQPRLTNDGIAKAREAVDAFLDACIAQPVLAPVGNCGFEIINDEPNVSIDGIQWSIKQRPVVEFAAWQDGAWTVKTDTAGSFEMNAEGHLGSAHGEVGGIIDDYDVQGYVSLDDSGRLVFTSDYKGDDANTPNA
jgi:hypothetical protein